jgi:ribonuclease BN (tRNA processing enzyme)
MSSLQFLGTAGGRVLVFRQLRASGGLWLEINGTNILIDPGPGSLIRCLQYGLNPQNLDAVILTHKHLDHSADVNVIIEAISEGGLVPRGVLFAPADCYENDPVILKYNRKYLNEFITVKEKFEYELNGIKIEFPIKHEHGVETYGLKISNDKFKLSHIVDTKYFEALIPAYNGCDILIMNMVFGEPRDFPHLAYDDVVKLINGIKPKFAIVTHFGYQLWQDNVQSYVDRINKETGVDTIGAIDGLKVDLEKNNII